MRISPYLLSLLLITSVARAAVTPLPGDADGDGRVTAADVAIALRMAVNAGEADPVVRPALDLVPETDRGCHGDGRVDIADVVEVLRISMGGPAPSSPPCRLVSPIDGAEMAYIPAGSFLMGNRSGPINERPAHIVNLDAYYIDVTEVTNEQFGRFVGQTMFVAEGDWRKAAGPGRERYPVANVTWNDALAFTFWAGRRLPTEAEWEKAARGTDGRIWPWGDQFDPARFNFGGSGDSMPVGSFPLGASPYGVLDMAGNVCEWMADWYDRSYYPVSPLFNPQGPASGVERVVRGGSWEASAAYGMAMSRSKDTPHTHGPAIGFRCVLSLDPETHP